MIKSLSAMESKDFYKFCPKCGGELVVKSFNFLQCLKCQFNFFTNVSVTVPIILENAQGEILITKRKFDPGKGLWDTPGGFMEPGETLEECIKREANEELGIDVKLKSIVWTYPFNYLYQDLLRPCLDIMVVAEIISGEIKPTDDVEDFKFVNKSEFEKDILWAPHLSEGIRRYLKNS